MSKNYGRAIRRHHRARVIAVEFDKRWNKSWVWKNDRSDEARTAVLLYATRAQRTARHCSCYLCSNGRRKYGNSRAALTFQELAALENLKERDE